MAYRRRMGPKPTFWFAIVGLVVITPVVENILADRFGDSVPGLATLNDYTRRRNG